MQYRQLVLVVRVRTDSWWLEPHTATPIQRIQTRKNVPQPFNSCRVSPRFLVAASFLAFATAHAASASSSSFPTVCAWGGGQGRAGWIVHGDTADAREKQGEGGGRLNPLAKEERERPLGETLHVIQHLCRRLAQSLLVFGREQCRSHGVLLAVKSQCRGPTMRGRFQKLKEVVDRPQGCPPRP